MAGRLGARLPAAAPAPPGGAGRPGRPVALGFLAVCLLVALLWDTPGPPTRLADACCGYRGWRPGFGLGSTDRPEKGESETAEKGESQSESENGSDKEGDRHEDPPGQEVQHECPSDCDTANGEQP